ncbi:hypothetical protein HF521_020092 [Silurus meridionalis]|uniref:Chemokine interleukin-8-like domain-containing protein n=1 Tax=Silurus meridionalis TaxID=175797 RepID=A0A8T0BIF0_SILME|nr:hypothetical protein HF521_020092 [Silurus meridionalis]
MAIKHCENTEEEEEEEEEEEKRKKKERGRYKLSDHLCSKPGVIFTRHVCVDPELEWVQYHMKSLDQILNERLNKPQTSVTSSLQQSSTTTHNSNVPDSCCFRYQRNPIPIRLITGYKVTEHHCAKPAVIFTLKNSHHVCLDPELKWVQKHMKSLDQILNERLN